MASFMQWRARADAGKVFRVTWVGGEQSVLREEVVDFIRGFLQATDYVSFEAGSDAERDIWSAVNQYSLEAKATRLVVVREAQLVENWKPLEDWMNNMRQMPNVYLVFVSNQRDEYVIGPDKRHIKDADGKAVLWPALQLIQPSSAGYLVTCKVPATKVPVVKGKPTRAGPPDIVLWLQRFISVSQADAEYLLARVGGDLSKAKNVCLKARVLSPTVQFTRRHLELISEESAGEGFVAALVARNKPRALRDLAGVEVSYSTYSGLLARIGESLDLLGVLNDAIKARKDLWDVKRELPERWVFKAEQLWPVAQFYDRTARSKCWRALLVADDAMALGDQGIVQVGVMEMVVAFWG